MTAQVETSPERKPGSHRVTWLRRSAALAIVAALGGAYVTKDTWLGHAAHRDHAAELAKARKGYDGQFPTLSPTDQFDAQYITGLNVIISYKKVGGRGMLGNLSDDHKAHRATYNIGGSCLANTPYDPANGAVVTPSPDPETNPDQRPTGNQIYTVYPDNPRAPELKFLYSQYGVPSGILPVGRDYEQSGVDLTQAVLDGKHCPHITLVAGTNP